MKEYSKNSPITLTVTVQTIDEIAIFEMYSGEPTVYYEVVEIDGKYVLEV